MHRNFHPVWVYTCIHQQPRAMNKNNYQYRTSLCPNWIVCEKFQTKRYIDQNTFFTLSIKDVCLYKGFFFGNQDQSYVLTTIICFLSPSWTTFPVRTYVHTEVILIKSRNGINNTTGNWVSRFRPPPSTKRQTEPKCAEGITFSASPLYYFTIRT